MLSRLRTEIFPEAVEAEAFGPDVTKFVSFEPNSNRGSDQFASDVMFGHVTVEKKSGERLTENVVIKIQPSTEIAHLVFDCDGQFSNEILFYTKIIPAFRKYDSDDILSTNFSKFIYGKATCGKNPKDDIIILEDMTAKGYKLTKERLAIDEKHINLALDRIGKFHALSFKLQAEEPEKFQELISQIKPTKRDNDGSFVPKNFLTMTTMRGVNPLRDDPRYKDKLEDLCKHFENATEYADKYQEPSESLNVITHGDFCRNNMMFKYKNNGEPDGVVFFDLATIKYCSPVVDLSFLLSLNTSLETRRLHWNEFLQRYYGALTQQLDGHSARPSFETVELEMRKRGVYGYYLCSFFLPSMIRTKTKEDWDKEALDEEFSEDRLLQEGGQQATDSLADLVRHMLDTNYIFEV